MAKAKKKRKDPFEGKRDPVSQLYRAVKRYVEHNNGTVLVIGGIQIEQTLGDRELNFHVAVRCLGRLPTFSATAGGEP